MAEFSFTSSDGKPFTIKGPQGFTRDQAEAVFKKQDATGALVGFKPGEVLSAATQAADGLSAAQGALAQAQSGISGSLGAFASTLSTTGVDIASGRIPSVDAAFARGGAGGGAGAFTSVLGSVASGLGAAGGALGGSLAGTTPGLTATVGPAVSSLTSAGTALVGAAGIQGSTAIASIETINRTITQFSVTSPINTADFAKVVGGTDSLGAVSGIGPMGIPEVNGVLAQAKNLVNQASSVLSNDKGLGSFGLSAGQLETAGYVKPGTNALLSLGTSTFNQVVGSPASWTGKDGIKSATDLLANAPKQSQIQQDLMAKGVAGLATVGVPVASLSSQGLAGMALNAAKSLPDAEAFVKGLPIPGDAGGEIAADFSAAVRDAAFAVNLVNTKIPAEFKQQDIPVPVNNTVNRATVDAASTRVIGDDKVPVPNYGAKADVVANQADVEDYINKAFTYINQYLNPAGRGLQTVDDKLTALENQQTITPATFSAINGEYNQVKQAFNSDARSEAGTQYLNAYNKLTPEQRGTASTLSTSPQSVVNKQSYIVEQSSQIRERLAKLSLRVEGGGIYA